MILLLLLSLFLLPAGLCDQNSTLPGLYWLLSNRSALSLPSFAPSSYEAMSAFFSEQELILNARNAPGDPHRELTTAVSGCMPQENFRVQRLHARSVEEAKHLTRQSRREADLQPSSEPPPPPPSLFSICYMVLSPSPPLPSASRSFSLLFPFHGAVLSVNAGELTDDLTAAFAFPPFHPPADTSDLPRNVIPVYLSMDGLLNVPVVFSPLPEECARVCFSGSCVPVASRDYSLPAVYISDMTPVLRTVEFSATCESTEGLVLFEDKALFSFEGNFKSFAPAANATHKLGLGRPDPQPPPTPQRTRIAFITGAGVGGAELTILDECR
jgi:hypothetical protein